MKFEIKSIDEVHAYEKNPRKNDLAVDYVANSIKEFGFKIPIVIDAKGVIVAGHTRLKAARKLGLKKVPCIIADDLNAEQVKAFRLADNKTAEYAEWDRALLEMEIADLGLDMSLFGFDDELNDFRGGMTGDDDLPKEYDSICKSGQIWEPDRDWETK